ncbi:hypothetical protein [Vibrio sp.]|uniref:hypothetical protein n=1 Tax=Vibrio sp. TaxID=678 RepID=UPI003D142612
MKGLKVSLLAVMAAGLMAAPAAYADNSASAFTDDGTAVIGAAALRSLAVNAAESVAGEGYVKVLSTELKNSGTPKDLVIGLSFETSLFTETVVRSKGGNKDTSTASAEISMKVFVDGVEVAPGEVVFDRRYQELWASLGGVLDCQDTIDESTGEPDGIISFDECNLLDEEIGLILDTKAAHSFNFLAYNIGSGSHTIEAYAKLDKGGEAQNGSSDASASLGKGTLSVWEVHGSNDTSQ